MTNIRSITRSLALSSALALSLIPVAAYAGKHEQAVEAIAQARAKIEAGDKVGTNNQAPELQSQARAELVSAESLLSNGKKEEAIAAAKHASGLADQAIVVADNRKASAERDRRLDAQSATIDAQQAANAANVRADTAQQAASSANDRAYSAQQATVAANAEADALRNAPKPAPTTTTVAIVERETVHAPVRTHVIKRKVVRKHRPVTHIRKTTTVTTTTR